MRLPAAVLLVLLLGQATAAGEEGWVPLGADAWHNSEKWYAAGDAMLDPDNPRRLVGKPGTGVLINGETGRVPSLVTKRRDFRDVELHVEFMVAKGSNSGVIFHGNYEIQILDSAQVEKPTGAHCGGIYPRAEAEPTYHHIDKGSPPRVNAAKPPGQWQTLDILFRAARFDEAGKKTASARFVRVVHNGQVVQENQEVPYACGPNWDRKQYPRGPIIIQGDYGPIAVRNVRVRDCKGDGGERPLNVPPEGFTALFNGKDFRGWRMSPKAKQFWSIEDGVLKSHGLLEEWGADLVTEKAYRDFVLMLEFRMPTISDSGISFRRLIPEIPGFGNQEQFNLRSRGGMGHLESYYFLPKETAEKHGLKEDEKPHVRHIDPKVGVWHKVTLTVRGRTITTEFDGEVLLDNFKYHDWMINMEPAPIRLQKHKVVHGDNLGEENPCPIEYRNIFIKEIGPSESGAAREMNVPPPGFTALFNGKDFTGWRLDPKRKAIWSIEGGVLKALGPLEEWGADLDTVNTYRDFVLLIDYRLPAASNSGIFIRGLVPAQVLGGREKINIGPGWMGHPLSFHYLPPDIKLASTQFPRVKDIRPEVGGWHTMKITLVGQTLSIEVDGEVILRDFTYPDGYLSMKPSPIGLQKHRREIVDGKLSDMPVEFRNVFIKEIAPSGAGEARPMNVPPRGFTALFNGKNLKKYRDFVLLVDFRFPAISDSGIWFRGIPGIMGGMEQFNLMSVYGTGNLDSLDHLPAEVQRSFRDAAYTPFFYCQPEYYRLKEPPVRYTLSAEYDGHVMHDRFEYPEGTISLEPAPIRLQKHIPQTIAGTLHKECPIEFRNVFIKELGPGAGEGSATSRGEAGKGGDLPNSPTAKLLARIEAGDLPQGYDPRTHQDYVDRRMAGLSEKQRARIGELWQAKQRLHPQMPNRGASFVKILEYVAAESP